MENSNEFMLLFRFEPDFNHVPSAEEMSQMHQQWGAYFGGLAASGQLVSTHQLGFEGLMVAADKTVTTGINITEKQTLGGNLIIKAKNLQEAAEIAKKSPILFMGGNVEVRVINPM
jgi:hypothetical protein